MVLPLVDVAVMVPPILLQKDESRSRIRFDDIPRQDARIPGDILAVPLPVRRIDVEHPGSPWIRHQADPALIVVVIIAEGLRGQ